LFGRSGAIIDVCDAFMTAGVTDGLGGPSQMRFMEAHTAGGNWSGLIASGTGKPPPGIIRKGATGRICLARKIIIRCTGMGCIGMGCIGMGCIGMGCIGIGCIGLRRPSSICQGENTALTSLYLMSPA
jgi:hypothetical protein